MTWGEPTRNVRLEKETQSSRISQGFLKSVTVPVIASDSEAIFW
jgi:hypothetical protein